jgi:hypothetical protein
MGTSRVVAGIVSVALAGLTAAVPSGATLHRTMYISFSGPVRLPGVSLAAGTYIFERADPETRDIVRVASPDRKRVYLTAFTRPVPRPAGVPATQAISFGEASRDLAPPVRVWWPADESVGREFIYR